MARQDSATPQLDRLTPAQIEALLADGDGDAAGAPIPRRADLHTLPLSFLQRRLWFLDRLEGASPLYNIHQALDLAGPLDAAALAAALGLLARRHESLRARFVPRDGEPHQELAPAGPPPLAVVDLSALAADVAEREAARLAGEEARRPFDLARAPLWRCLLVRRAPLRHVVAMSLHHIVADGWSAAVVVGELAACYREIAAGRPPRLPAPPLQYADFAAWQNGWMRGGVLADHLTFWREELRGAPLLAVLPTDRPRPAVRRPLGHQAAVRLDAALLDAVRRILPAETTTYMAVLAGYQALLHRLGGQDDLLVGSPLAGRDRVELEGVVGPCVNTAVRRARFAGAPTFAALLAQVRARLLAAAPWSGLPFERLVEELQPERSTSHGPIFQVWLVLQGTRPPLGLAGIEVREIASHSGTAKFDLTLDLAETPDGGAGGALEASADLFDRATAARLAAQLAGLLAAAAAAPGEDLAALPLLAAPERHQLVHEWGGEAPTAVPPRALGALLAHGMAAGAAAGSTVEMGGDSWTYGELAARANQLARWLRRQGVGPETAVGLSVRRSLDMVAGLLGTLAAGGACVPLDPDLPADRLDLMLADAGVTVLLTQQDLLYELPAGAAACEICCLDSDWYTVAEESAEPLAGEAPDAALAYLLFTSGSTGRPKPVAVGRGALAAHLRTVGEMFALTAADRVLQFATLGFDVALEQVLGALAAGASLVLRGDEAWSVEQLDAALRRGGVTIANLPTGLWHQWVVGGAPPPALRLVIAGGEAMPAGTAAHARETAPEVALLNAYGPTEAVITASFLPVEAAPAGGAPVPIGWRPVRGRTARVLDGAGLPAGLGVTGELYLGGDLLARGYHGRPDLTAAAFVPDPLGAAGARRYRSGDLARWRTDGRLEFAGRRDRQVKVRGFRIELGEVEEALRRHPGVADATVVAAGERPDERRLLAYVVGAPGAGAPGTEELREHLAHLLPSHMVPGETILLEALPRNASGKVDVAALPPGAGSGSGGAAASDEPRGDLEQAVAEIWSEVLQRRGFGVHEDFFDLGGHSLLGTQVISRVLERFGVELPLQTLFAAPTVASFGAQLAEALETAGVVAAGAPPAMPPLVPMPRQAPLELSWAQQRIWFEEQAAAGAPVYVLPAAIDLAGPLDGAALQASFAAVVGRHEALRTTFPLVDDRPVQSIAATLAVPLPVVDLGALPAARRGAEQEAWMDRAARRPFDLARGPLLRLLLFRQAADRHGLLLVLHHAAADGWSCGVLVREIAAAYPRLAAGLPVQPAALPVQYADFAAWQRGHFSGAVLDDHLEHWRQALGGRPPRLTLPADHQPAHAAGTSGSFLPLSVDGASTDALRRLAHDESATLFMALAAGWAALLGRWAGQEDLLLGTVMAGRRRAQTEDLIGCFVNVVPLRADLRGNPTFRQLLARVRSAALDAFAHQDLPFERLAEELRRWQGPEAGRGETLLPAMFVFQNAPLPPLDLGTVRGTSRRLDTGTSHFDVTLELAEDAGGRLSGVLEYRTALFRRSTIAALAAALTELLQRVAQEPDLSVLELDLAAAPTLAPAAAPALAAGRFSFEVAP